MKGIEAFNVNSQPPPSALKRIGGGRLEGMTDINPQWRYRAMTEQYGLCGFGWKYTIDRQWSEPSGTGEILCFCTISLYVKDGETWSDAIPGTGGSTLVAKEKSGLHSSDEGYKMANTDALSVAMKQIGVASAIYEGRWDGAKYSVEKAPEQAKAPVEVWNPEARVIWERLWAKAVEARKFGKINDVEIAQIKEQAKRNMDRPDIMLSLEMDWTSEIECRRERQ